MNKEVLVYPYGGILCKNKNEQTPDTGNNMHKTQKYAERKKTESLYNFIHIIQKQTKLIYGHRKQNRGCCRKDRWSRNTRELREGRKCPVS